MKKIPPAKIPPILLRDIGCTERGRAVFQLAETFDYRKHNGAGMRIVIPAGFLTDFASVPRLLWPLYNPAGPWRPAALLHDYLYSRAANCSRFLADAVFREVMDELGVPWLRRAVLYYAVRLFGRRAYRSR